MYHKVAFFASFLRCFAAYRLTRWRLARYNAHFFAQMAELVDALVSGTSVRKDVEVRVFFWAPNFEGLLLRAVLFVCLKPDFQAASAFAAMNRISAYALILLFTLLFILLFGGSSCLAAYRNPAPALALNSAVSLIPATA